MLEAPHLGLAAERVGGVEADEPIRPAFDHALDVLARVGVIRVPREVADAQDDRLVDAAVIHVGDEPLGRYAEVLGTPRLPRMPAGLALEHVDVELAQLPGKVDLEPHHVGVGVDDHPIRLSCSYASDAPRRNTLPARAEVFTRPSSTTGWPLTKTCSIPVGGAAG